MDLIRFLNRWTGVLVFALMLFLSSKNLLAGGDCSKTSVGMTPINDLGTGMYKGYQGGLYLNGLNTPPEPYASDGIAIANAIRPLNASGSPDDANGKIGLVTIGMSNTAAESRPFVLDGNADPEKSAGVVLVNGAKSGQSADRIADINADYWDHVQQQVARGGLSDAQVQIAWVKQATPMPSAEFPTEAVTLQGYLEDIARDLLILFPNMKIVYYTSRIYAGYATGPLNPEPHAYETAFAVRWMIEKQINGDPDLNYDPDKGEVKAPYVTWGPYIWADGLTPRSDGLTWECGDLANDGTHPSDQGSEKVANLLLDFLKTDATAVPWFLKNGTTPVQLSSFNAILQGSDVLLHWVTGSERNNYGYEIQRKDDSTFETIAFVAGQGNADQQNNYEFLDKNLQSGPHGYRLKQVDLNGGFAYSASVNIEVAAPQAFRLDPNYPNPFRSNTTLFYQLPERSFITVRIYNILGQEIVELAAREFEAGLHSIQWNGLDKNQQRVAAGMYLVTLWRNTPQGTPQLVAKRKIIHTR